VITDGSVSFGTIITDSIAAEFEVIFKKILDCIKGEMSGSYYGVSARDELGYSYPSAIERDYYVRIRPAPHYGHPGAQWQWDTSIPGQVCKKINVLYTLAQNANTYRLQKEEQKRRRDAEEIVSAAKAKEDNKLFNEYFPILKKSIVITPYNRKDIFKHDIYPSNNFDYGWRILPTVNVYILVQFKLETIKEIEEKIGLQNTITLTVAAIEESSLVDIVKEIYKKDLYEQKIHEEVKRRLAEKEFDQKVEAEIKRMASLSDRQSNE